MGMFRWIIIAAFGGLLVSGAWALVGTQGSAGAPQRAATGVEPSPAPAQEAQLRQPAPAAPAPAAAAPAAPSAPHHVETTQYDSWVATCEDTTVAGAAKRTCGASLSVQDQNRGMLLNWQIGFNQDGRLVNAVHVADGLVVKQGDQTVGGPILIADGVELKFGNGPVHRLSYVWCGPKQCMAEAPIDDAFTKEAVASAKATITVHLGGGTIPFELPIKGIDKALAAVRK